MPDLPASSAALFWFAIVALAGVITTLSIYVAKLHTSRDSLNAQLVSQAKVCQKEVAELHAAHNAERERWANERSEREEHLLTVITACEAVLKEIKPALEAIKPLLERRRKP